MDISSKVKSLEREKSFIEHGPKPSVAWIWTPSLQEDGNDAQPISEFLDLHTCARFGNMKGLESLASSASGSLQVNALDETGITALHYAARFNQYAAVVWLVEKGKADVCAKDPTGATPLHYAARKQQHQHSDDAVNIIRYLASHKAGVNIEDRWMSTPLHFAARRGNEVVTKALLECDTIEINKQDLVGSTPLHEAVTYGHLGVAKLLIQHGCQLLVQDDEMILPVHLAALEGDIHMLKLLLSELKENTVKQVLHCVDIKQNCPLHFAVENRHAKVVAELISRGADVNAVCRNETTGSSCLHLAAITGDVRICKMLIEAGARTDVVDRQGATPIDKAAEYQSTEVAILLLENRYSNTLKDGSITSPLLVASCFDNREIVQTLLAKGANINTTDSQERTALLLATENDQLEVAKLLVEWSKKNGQQELLHTPDRLGNTPLHVAAQRGNKEIAQYLIGEGARIQAKNENERSAFHLAAMNGHPRVCLTLLRKSKGKCLNDEDEDSSTALHLAASAGHADVVKLLISKGADKEARNSTSRTPLYYAALAGHTDIVQYLLSEKVPINAVDKEKTTVLHLASSKGHVGVVDVLMQQGADVSRHDLAGNNALDLAIDKGNTDVAAYVIKSAQWRKALMNETVEGKEKIRNTPLRKLINKMPDVTKTTFDRCIRIGPPNTNFDDPDFWIELNYEILDDVYSKWTDIKSGATEIHEESFDKDGLPRKDVAPYCTNQLILKTNHPLQILASSQQESLMRHPLVLALVRRKWRNAHVFYFILLTFYAIFLTTLTIFSLSATPPHSVNATSCELNASYPVQKTRTEETGSVLIILLSVIGLLNEFFQVLATKMKYLSRPSNILDWFIYVAAIVFVVDLTNCHSRTDWQWQLGTFANFTAWMNLVLMLRRFPSIGLYAVMLTKILRTFLQFAIIYLIFLVAFGLSFFLLLSNQVDFRSPILSIIKMAAMMLGELDYSAIYHDGSNAVLPELALHYKIMAYVMLVAYLILMPIVVMNLLTALAVDDVTKLRDYARLKKMAMQIDLALDVEVAMPSWMAKWLQPVVAKERWYPNRRERSQFWWWWWIRLLEGPFSQQLIVAYITGTYSKLQQSAMEDTRASGGKEIKDLNVKLTSHIADNSTHMKSVHEKLDRLEKLLSDLPSSPKKFTKFHRGPLRK